MKQGKDKKVLVSKKGREYLPHKILRQGPKSISKAILFRYKKRSGIIESVLAIKRFRVVDGAIEIPENPKKDVTLDAEELQNLLEYLSENIEAFRSGLKKYFPVDLDENSLTAEQVLDILNTLSQKEVKRTIEKIKTNPRLLTLANSIQIQKYQEGLGEFENRLKSDYPEDGGDDSWQAWLTKNYWIFGSNYKTPIPKARINIQGSKPDYLFPTIDGFVDGIDIKKPNIPSILIKDSNHPGSFCWSSDINRAISQVVNYLYDLEENRLKLAEILRINVARPRGIIVAGRSKNWTKEQSKFYRKLSFALHGIEVLTYDHLLDRARSMLDIFVHRQNER